MIKVETLGMLDIAKINPVLKSEEDVKNYSFLTADGILYLISNTVVGDDAYLKDVVIPAGDFLNGYQVDAWVGQKLVIDGKHIEGGVAALNVGDALVVAEDGGLKAGSAAGVHFVITDKTTLTEAAVKARVAVA
jgi:hypothetical protein